MLRADVPLSRPGRTGARGIGSAGPDVCAIRRARHIVQDQLDAKAGGLQLPLGSVPATALVHGHCHQKSFGAFKPVEKALRLIPDLNVETIESSCCGMAGAFGYGADTYQAAMEMAELSLLPAVRRADEATLIVADGTSCRHQIRDSTERSPLHVARVLALSLDRATSNSTPFSIAKDPIHG